MQQQSPVRIESPPPFSRVIVDRIPSNIMRMAHLFRESLKRGTDQHGPTALYALSGSVEALSKINPDWRQAYVEEFRHLPQIAKYPLCDWTEYRRDAFLGRLFRASWTKETCCSMHRGSWTSLTPEWGQSSITALLIQELFGGTLRQYAADGYGLYFSNVLENAVEIDLTRSQFKQSIQLWPKTTPVERDFLLNPSDRDFARAAEVKERYELLKENFLLAATAMALACASLPSLEERTPISENFADRA